MVQINRQMFLRVSERSVHVLENSAMILQTILTALEYHADDILFSRIEHTYTWPSWTYVSNFESCTCLVCIPQCVRFRLTVMSVNSRRPPSGPTCQVVPTGEHSVFSKFLGLKDPGLRSWPNNTTPLPYFHGPEK